MSDGRVCITNDLDAIPRAERPHACRRRGIHYAACENPDDCWGCVPRDATNGMLCDVCWAKLDDALGRVGMLIAHLRSIDTNGHALGERVATSMDHSLIVPQSWLAADGLMEALGAPQIPSTASIDDTFVHAADAVTAWSDAESIVNTREGAKRAVVLVKRIQTALHRWPDSEAEYRHIPYMLCPTCRYRSLYRQAPLEYLDDIFVLCGTKDCEYQHEWFDWSAKYSPIFEHIEDDIKRRERTTRRTAKSA